LRIDINKASWAELSLLPGVGEARAKAIVASREKQGPFSRPEDLGRIRGIGPRTIEGLRGYLSPLPGEAIYVDSGRERDPVP
jgi:competence protein ComEA